MSASDATIYVVDDDPSVRKAISRLLASANYRAQTFESAESFLQTRLLDGPACVILDLQLPGTDGMEVQRQLKQRQTDLPVIFLTGFGDVPSTVQAMKDGACDFLTKPVDDDILLATVEQAVQQNVQSRHRNAELKAFRTRVESLTPREHEVMQLVTAGLLNKQIARQMGITETTVKVHRGRMMEKTQVASVAELAVLCERCGLSLPNK